MILTGLDRLLQDSDVLVGRRFALLSHSPAVTADLRPVHLALLDSGAPRPEFLLGPEHGFYGVEQDMVPSEDGLDAWSGLPIVSLYGESTESLRPDPELFREVDLLVIDLQDIGTRFYTYAASAVWAAAAALGNGCEVWILDRPNPLGGTVVEGNLRQPGFESFVGAFPIPVRHGLTLGEIALLEAQRWNWNDGLKVWQMEGWNRQMIWHDVGRPWIAPSPNMPTEEIAFLYPGSCLIEATELSEGRGTARPFQLIGAPGLAPVELADRLNALELGGVRFIPTYFRPQFQKHRGEVCAGVDIRLTDPVEFLSFRCGVELLIQLQRLAPKTFAWRRAAYEFVEDRPAIDLLSGDSALREAIDSGGDASEWITSWRGDEEEFRQIRREILLYPE